MSAKLFPRIEHTLTSFPYSKDAQLASIGIIDSGIGGLSVLRHIRQRLPNESLIYFADAGFAPYGDKTEKEVIQRTLFVTEYLVRQEIKALVVACNTATAAAIKLIRAHYPELILVGVEPGLKPAASLTKNGCIGVLATSRTLASQKYQQLCERIQHAMQVRFINQACPGLATQIELGELETEATVTLLSSYLQPLFAAQVDTIVLGCTHYPFIAHTIQRLAAQHNQMGIQLIDTGIAITKQLQRLLEQHQRCVLNTSAQPIHCITSGDPHHLQQALDKLLHLQPDQYVTQRAEQSDSAHRFNGATASVVRIRGHAAT